MNTLAWTLDEAVVFLREVQAVVEPLGYHTGLIGSVVLKGQSENDLDIVIYPARVEDEDRWKPHQRAYVVFSALVDLGMCQTHTASQVHAAWRRMDSNDTKHVEKWVYRGKTVDVFFLE